MTAQEEITPAGVVHKMETTQTQRLSLWSQTSPRDYISYALCFPLERGATARQRTEAHLKESVKRLSASRPEFAGGLYLSRDPTAPGDLVLALEPGGECIMTMFEDISDCFGQTYDELKAQSFPPAAFAHPRFQLGINPNPADVAQPTSPPQHPAGAIAPTKALHRVPVSIVQGYFIDGGIIILAHLHHGFCDGECMRLFITCLAGATRGEKVPYHPDWSIQEPDLIFDHVAKLEASDPGATVEDLARRCPEYTFHPGELVGPTQPVVWPGGTSLSAIPTAAKIFVFKKSKLNELREYLAPRPGERVLDRETRHHSPEEAPTEYVALSALTWSHVSLARSTTEEYLVSAQPPPDIMTPASTGVLTGPGFPAELPPCLSNHVATLMSPVNWKTRVPRGKSDEVKKKFEGYFGNATVKCLTRVPFLWPIQAAGGPVNVSFAREAMDPSYSIEPDHAMRLLAAEIRDSLAATEADYVADRTRLYTRLADPRNLGLATDPRVSHDMQFNTWRPFGADDDWCVAGFPDTDADADGSADAAASASASGKTPLKPPHILKPDAVRKAFVKGKIDFLNMLIMPGQRDSEDVELLACMPADSLERLCKNQRWMQWVDRVIG